MSTWKNSRPRKYDSAAAAVEAGRGGGRGGWYGLSAHNRRLGTTGEDLAAAWYERAGYRVVARNWRCRDGELDLVLVGHGAVVFSEVKARSSDRFGVPAEAVSVTKQRRIRGLAARFLQENPQRGGLRFDVVSILDGDLSVIEAAF